MPEAPHGPVGEQQAPMLEFLIRRADAEWFDFPFEHYPEILRPKTITSRPVQGWGSHRIEVEGVEISFSDEEPGLQVVFETGAIDPGRARQIVDDICRNIESRTGQKTSVVEF